MLFLDVLHLRSSTLIVKSFSFIRYSFTEHIGRATPKGMMKTNIRLYRYL